LAICSETLDRIYNPSTAFFSDSQMNDLE